VIKAAIYVILAWLPFDRLFTFPVAGITVTLGYVGATGVAIVSLIGILIGRNLYRLRGVDYGVLAVSSLYVTSTLLSDNARVAGLLAINAIFVPTLLYFSIRTNLSSPKDIRNAVLASASGVCVLSILAFLQFSKTGERPLLLANDSISIASVVMLPFLVSAFEIGLGKWLRLVIFTATTLGLIATMSRAYLLFVLLSPFLFWAFKRRLAFVMALAMILGSLLVTLLITIDESLVAVKGIDYKQDRGIERVLNPDHWKQALYNRVKGMYQPSLSTFLDNPLVGQGLIVHSNQTSTTHNFHWEWLESGGVIGYMAYAGMFLAFFWQVGRIGARDRTALAAAVAVFAVLVNALTNGLMHGVMPWCAMVYMGISQACIEHLSVVKPVAGRIHPNLLSA
jgi:hypothetical protein